MKEIINLRNLISILAFLSLNIFIFGCGKAHEPEKKETRSNSYQVKFQANPDSFSGEGGYGEITGVLQEIAPDGKLVSETPLSSLEYKISLTNSNIEIFNGNKFRIPEDVESDKFNFEATVISGNAKGHKQKIVVFKGGINFVFKAEPYRFTSKGGTGKVKGTMQYTDYYGKVLKERKILDGDFGLRNISETEGINIDEQLKTFTVVEGGTASFTLQASSGYGTQKIEIKRE